MYINFNLLGWNFTIQRLLPMFRTFRCISDSIRQSLETGENHGPVRSKHNKLPYARPELVPAKRHDVQATLFAELCDGLIIRAFPAPNPRQINSRCYERYIEIWCPRYNLASQFLHREKLRERFKRSLESTRKPANNKLQEAA